MLAWLLCILRTKKSVRVSAVSCLNLLGSESIAILYDANIL